MRTGSEGVVRHPVEVESDGVTLRGWLFEPASRPEQIPAVVMIHGFSATIEGMVADRYAEAFARTGVAALLVDTRGFGRSDGDPRCQIDPWAEARDYLACIDHLTGTDGIDTEAIAIWGDSLSGRVAAVVAAVDRRVAAVIVQCPVFGDELEPPDLDGSKFDTIRSLLLDNTFGSYEEKVIGPMPVVSSDQLTTPSFLLPITAFHWFISYGARFGTGWQNQATQRVIDTPIAFSPQPCIPHIDVPFLLVVAEGDEMPWCDAAIARQVHASSSGPREVLEIGGGHFGLVYHDSEHFTSSVAAQQSFLATHLLGA
jgi:pimeloyl-ACP methyl ester carboxylesterase